VLCVFWQVINGISVSTFSSNVTLYTNTLTTAIAECMDGVTSGDIINLVVASASRESGHDGTATATAAAARNILSPLFRGTSLLAQPKISAAYTVQTNSAGLTYSSMSQQLKDAVSGGQFNTYLSDASAQTGATGLLSATSDSVTTVAVTSTDDDDGDDSGGGGSKGLGGGAIAGIVLGCLVLCLLLAAAVHFTRVEAEHRSHSMSSTGTGAGAGRGSTIEAPFAVNPLGRS
jgi:hypothetical protein